MGSPNLFLTATAALFFAQGSPGAPARDRASVLLPGFPNPQDVPEAVLFGFDTLAFPDRENLEIGLIQGQNPRRVLDRGPKDSPDEYLGYTTVHRIDGMFHLWTTGYCTGKEQQSFCYYRSKDGLHWERPDLGLVEFDGSRKNNLFVWPFEPGTVTVFLVLHDPEDPNPDRRFKMVANLYPGGSHKQGIAYSPDGLRWKAASVAPGFFEMGGIAKFKGTYYMTGQGGMPRRLDVMSSQDFDRWTRRGSGFARDHLPQMDKEEHVLPDWEKWAPGGIGGGEQVHVGATLWNRGNVMLGIYDAWHGRKRDRRLITIDHGLVLSHDALKYVEPVAEFRLQEARKLPAVPKTMGPAVTHGQAIANVGEKTYFWWSFWHADPEAQGVYLSEWDRDRLGYLKPAGDGKAVSAPLRVTRGEAPVYVNASGLDEKNHLRISLLDEQSRPLPGFSGPDAAVLSSGGLRMPLAWKGGKALSPAHGTVRIQVSFEGMNGRLHAAYVGDSEPDPR